MNRDQAEYHYRLHTAARDTPPREQPELTLLHRFTGDGLSLHDAAEDHESTQ